ncbi:MAG: hypothetical protein R3E89_19715 [Thiolinea sp.]
MREHVVQTSSLEPGDFLQQGRYSPQFIHQHCADGCGDLVGGPAHHV